MPGQFCCGDRADDGPAAGGRSYMWCVRGDWCAYLCVAFVYLSLISIDITTTTFCIYPLYGGWQTTKGKVHIVFFQFIVFMVLYSHLAASWQDPGLTPKDKTGFYKKLYDAELRNAVQAKKDGDASLLQRLRKVYCLKCESPKPAGAHHCSTCGRCVRQMDHHCPWINNCVGERNWKSFFLFLSYVTIGTGYAIVINILRVHQIITSTKFEDRHSTLPRNTLIGIVIWCVLSFVFAIFFFAFVMCMFYDQYEAFTTGVPGVDAMQMTSDAPRRQGCLTGLRTLAMANERFSLRWFIPVPPSTLEYKRPQPPITAPPPTTGDGDELTSGIGDKLNEPLLKETMKKQEAQYDAWAKKFDDLGLSKPQAKTEEVSSPGEDGNRNTIRDTNRDQTHLQKGTSQNNGGGSETAELEAVRAELADIEREMNELVKDINDLEEDGEDNSNEPRSEQQDSEEEEDE